jgi:VanZ family protein
MAAVAYARPMAWPWHRVLLAALFLALASEALQFFATDRHPRWLDVGIDMAGAVVGLGLVMVRVRWIAASLRSSQ